MLNIWLICVVLLNELRCSGSDSHVFSMLASTSRPSNSSQNDTMDVVVGAMYTADFPSVRRSEDPIPNYKEINKTTIVVPEIFYESMDNEINDEAGDQYLLNEKKYCEEGTITSCWTYNAMDGIRRQLWLPVAPEATQGRSISDGVPYIVKLPTEINDTLTVVGRSAYWGLGNAYLFIEKQLSKYIGAHGIVFPAETSWNHAVAKKFDSPVILESSEQQVEDPKSYHRKKKRTSILFPMLILFKFFKIKIILLPILLTVLLIKKLLIATLALAPNLAGFFRVCRPQFGQPFGLAPAGLLQDVTDSRGEFSTLYNTYANPYRDYNGYRTRDWARYAQPQMEQPNEPPLNDY